MRREREGGGPGPRDDGGGEGELRPLLHRPALLRGLLPQLLCPQPTILARVAERHSRRDLGVDPSLYPPFIDALIDTVQRLRPELYAGRRGCVAEDGAEGRGVHAGEVLIPVVPLR